MSFTSDLLPGTLELLALKAISLGAEHGYGILLRIQRMSGGAFLIQQGALYPALYRLEHRGLVDASWATSENNRRAKFYVLTAAGRKALRIERGSWEHLVAAMAVALNATLEAL